MFGLNKEMFVDPTEQMWDKVDVCVEKLPVQKS